MLLSFFEELGEFLLLRGGATDDEGIGSYIVVDLEAFEDVWWEFVGLDHIVALATA